MAEATQTGSRLRVKASVTKDVMTAMIVLYPPKPSETPITVDEILAELDRCGICYGIDQDSIRRAIDEKTFNTPVKVASGSPPTKGIPASFTFNFDISEHHAPKVNAEGHIDYKDIHFIQNTEEGAVLVTKMPATDGVPGKNVNGVEVPAAPGKDQPFRGGENTKISDDGLALIATADGAINYVRGEVSVKSVLPIKGDVDHTVGNIDCHGTVKVSGDIKAGFNVTVSGDLEVNGNVEDCTIIAKGNIFIKGGFFGHGAGSLQAGGDVTVKFAEGQKIVAGGNINVGGEVVNCQLTAKGNIWVKGKRGKIIGGEIRAGKEIRASVIGSSAGTATHLVVAFDADLFQKHHFLLKEIIRLKADSERVKEALYGLYRLQIDGKMTPEREAARLKLEAFRRELPASIEELEREKAACEEQLREFRDARIIAEERIHTGVRANFGIIYKDLLEDIPRCKLMAEGNMVQVLEFRDK